jgi:hypothetical protein
VFALKDPKLLALNTKNVATAISRPANKSNGIESVREQ